MLSDLLGPFSGDLAMLFDGVPIPVAVRERPSATSHGPLPDLGDANTRVVILAGPEAMLESQPLHALAEHVGAPVANTWGAKGIYPWNDLHHMGTCGLQRDDFTLLGFQDFDLILAIGIDEAESPLHRFALAEVLTADPGQLTALRLSSASRPLINEPNALYTRMAAIAQPGYVDDSTPRHPARAVMDLKTTLGSDTRVTAQPGRVGLWVARTFPTDRMGSVVVPAHNRPAIGAAVGFISALQGTNTVYVTDTADDPVADAILELARTHELPLRPIIWNDVDWSRSEDLIAAAGPVVAWTS